MIALPLPISGYRVVQARPVHNGFVLVHQQDKRHYYHGVTTNGVELLGDSRLIERALVLRGDNRLQTNFIKYGPDDEPQYSGYIIDANSFITTDEPQPETIKRPHPNPSIYNPKSHAPSPYRCVQALPVDLGLTLNDTSVYVVRIGSSSVSLQAVDVGFSVAKAVAVSLDNLLGCVVTERHVVLFDL